MTRSSKLALVTLLAGLLSLASVTTVSADHLCTSYAQEHCEQVAAADDAILFHAAVVATPMHVLSGNGIGQEHFEAMSVAQPDRFIIAPSAPVATYLPRFAQEHYEAITAASPSTMQAYFPKFGQEHYEEIMAAAAASN